MSFEVYHSKCNPVKRRFVAIQEGPFSKQEVIEVAIILLAHSDYDVIVTEDIEYTMRYSHGDIVSYRDKQFLDTCKYDIVNRWYYRSDLYAITHKAYIAENEFPKIVREVFTKIEDNPIFSYLKLFNESSVKFLNDDKTYYKEFTKAIRATVPILCNLILELFDKILDDLIK